VSCAPAGDEGPTVYIVFQDDQKLEIKLAQTRKPKNKNKK
jgi:hypothetical protein